MSNTETRINRFLAFVMSIALAFGLIAIGGFTLKSSAASRGPDPEASLITVGGLVLYSNDATEMNAQDTQSLKMMGVTYDKASNTVTVGTATMFTAKEATNNELENGSFYTMNMGDLTIQVNRNGDFQDLFISAYEYDTTVTLKGPGKLTFGAIYLDMYGANARLHIANEPTVVIDPQNRCFGYAPAGDELINSYDGLVPSEAIVIDSQNAIQPSNFLTYDGAVEPSLQWDVKNDVTYTLSQEEANEMGLSAEELAEVNKTLQEEKTNLYYVTGLSYTFSPRSEEPSQPQNLRSLQNRHSFAQSTPATVSGSAGTTPTRSGIPTRAMNESFTPESLRTKTAGGIVKTAPSISVAPASNITTTAGGVSKVARSTLTRTGSIRTSTAGGKRPTVELLSRRTGSSRMNMVGGKWSTVRSTLTTPALPKMIMAGGVSRKVKLTSTPTVFTATNMVNGT